MVKDPQLELSLNQSLQLQQISFRLDNFGFLFYYHKYRCPPPLHVIEGTSKKMKLLMKLLYITRRY